MNEIISERPVAVVPGASSLSLLVGIDADPALLEKSKVNSEIVIDVSQWNVRYPKQPDRRITSYIFDRSRGAWRHSAETSFMSTTAYRNWSHVSAVYVNESETPLKETRCSSRQGPFVVESPQYRYLGDLGEGLQAFISAYATNNWCLEAAAGNDPLAPLREFSDIELRSFIHWCFEDNRTYELGSISVSELVGVYAAYIQRFASGSVSGVFGIANLEGAGQAWLVQGVVIENGIDGAVADIEASVMDVDGILHPNVSIRTLGVVPDSPAWMACRLADRCASELLDALGRRLGIENTFSDIAPNEFGTLVRFINGQTVANAEIWARMVKGYDSVGEVPVICSVGFGSDWVSSVIDDNAFPASNDIMNALNFGRQMTVNAVDIADFAKTSIPENPMVESVTMLKTGKIRVVLREPVYPDTVQRRGVMNAEDEPGTVLSYMAIHAFDLDFRGTLTEFPSATAYADPECTQKARHTNITVAGHVCLGDINSTQRTAAEIEARGGINMPNLGDFLQMLRQCNLDSAYNRDKEFLLLDPRSITEEAYNAREWNIPGLHRLSTNLSDFQAILAAATRPTTAVSETEEETE